MCQRRQNSMMFGRLVGRVEVERQLDAEHARQADRHVGVAGEVEVELQRVGERAAPGGEQVGRAAALQKERRRIWSHAVGDARSS